MESDPPLPGNKGFIRSADLERHYKVAHMKIERKPIFRDYMKFPRHKNPFSRRDHFRVHLRDYHREDFI